MDPRRTCSEVATRRLGYTSQDSVSRLDNQGRRVTDLELFVLADVLNAKFDDLFSKELRGKIKALWPHYRVKLSRGQLPLKQSN